MNLPNLTRGRVNQKLRTRRALVEAAADLVREGRCFTVADVADLAKVGRTTAYRYFPKAEALVAHAALYAITQVEQHDVNAALTGVDAIEERLSVAVAASDDSIAQHEHLYRTMLRMSLAGDDSDEVLPRRSGVRSQVLNAAIGSLREELGEKRYERLTAALSMFLGVEAAIVMQDVCLLSPREARRVKLWGAVCILRAAMTEVAHRPCFMRAGKRGQ